MKYVLVESIMGGVGRLVDVFDTEEEAKKKRDIHDRDLSIDKCSEEFIERVNENGGYIEKNML